MSQWSWPGFPLVVKAGPVSIVRSRTPFLILHGSQSATCIELQQETFSVSVDRQSQKGPVKSQVGETITVLHTPTNIWIFKIISFLTQALLCFLLWSWMPAAKVSPEKLHQTFQLDKQKQSCNSATGYKRYILYSNHKRSWLQKAQRLSQHIPFSELQTLTRKVILSHICTVWFFPRNTKIKKRKKVDSCFGWGRGIWETSCFGLTSKAMVTHKKVQKRFICGLLPHSQCAHFCVLSNIVFKPILNSSPIVYDYSLKVHASLPLTLP